jgi:hypothetical protein
MSAKMKLTFGALGLVILVTASVVLIYLLCILFGLQLGWILGSFLSALVATVWMVIRILKDPRTTDKTFDEYFYEDRPDLRRSGKE